MEASDRIQHTDLVVVENTFNRAQFEAGKIYFLNTQKLGKKVCWCVASTRKNAMRKPMICSLRPAQTCVRTRSGTRSETRSKILT